MLAPESTVCANVPRNLVENVMDKLSYVFFDWNGTLQMTASCTKEEKLVQRGLALYQTFPEKFSHISFANFVAALKSVKAESISTKANNSQTLLAMWKSLDLEFTPEEHQEMVHTFCTGDNATHLFPATKTTIEALAQRGIRMGLIRNSKMPERAMREKLKNLGLDHFFETVVMSGDVGFEKPDPAIFQAAIERANLQGVDPATIVYVGNQTSIDILGARQMGWRSVLLCHTEEHSQGLAHHDLPSIVHLLLILPEGQKTIITQDQVYQT